jgi:hypothetical protein
MNSKGGVPCNCHHAMFCYSTFNFQIYLYHGLHVPLTWYKNDYISKIFNPKIRYVQLWWRIWHLHTMNSLNEILMEKWHSQPISKLLKPVASWRHPYAPLFTRACPLGSCGRPSRIHMCPYLPVRTPEAPVCALHYPVYGPIRLVHALLTLWTTFNDHARPSTSRMRPLRIHARLLSSHSYPS